MRCFDEFSVVVVKVVVIDIVIVDYDNVGMLYMICWIFFVCEDWKSGI